MPPSKVLKLYRTRSSIGAITMSNTTNDAGKARIAPCELAFIDASRLVKQICIMGTEVEVDFLAWLHSPHCPKLAIRYGGIEPCAVSHAAFDLYYRAKIRQEHHRCASIDGAILLIMSQTQTEERREGKEGGGTS